jgi:hypothetical protein
MSTPGTGNHDGDRRDGGYVPGAYSAEEDTSGDYVPGMYSDGSSAVDTTPTREHEPTPAADTRPQKRTPVSATREQEPRTQVHTQAVPVSAVKHADDVDSRTREGRLPRGAAAGAVTHEAGSRSGVPTLGDRKLLHQREKEHFGGMKFGAGFFGWLTATGLFVLLSALVGTIAALFGFGGNLSTSDLSNASGEAQTAGLTAVVVLGVILFVSYFAGGYVAGRMARFSGVKQGVAVWLWAVIIAVVLGVIGLVVGNQAAAGQQFERLGVPSLQDLAGPGLIGLLIIAAVALVGAILGGLTGMRYHRKIDRTDFDALENPA